MTTPHLTAAIAQFIATLRYDDIPLVARAPIHVAFADTIGVAIAGANEDAPRLVAAMLNPAGDEALLLGGARRASALDAALINGTAAHALDYDDVSQRGIGHASASIVPAILAEAEAVDATGAQMVAAYAAGYETIAELARRDADVGRYHDKGWHPTGFFGAIAAAAACASLRGLDAGQCAMALGIAASQAAGLIANVGTMTKPLHTGRAAHAGVAAARLAASGFTAAGDVFDHVPGFLHAYSFGGRIDLESPVALGRQWQICDGNRISVKKYPMCFCTHRALDGMFDLLDAQPLAADDIDRIEVTISRRNLVILRNHRPQTGLEAKFSIEFAVAAPVIARRAGLSELADAFVLRPDVRALMSRVVVKADDRDDPDRPGYALADRVVVFDRARNTHDSGPISHVRGDHDSPLTTDALRTKFDDCIAFGNPAIDRRLLFDVLMDLGNAGRVVDLMAALSTPL